VTVIDYICATFMVLSCVALLCLDVILIHNIAKVAAEYLRQLQAEQLTIPAEQQFTPKEEVSDAAHPASSGQ